MTKFGETHNFKAPDFVKKLEEFVGKKVDRIIYNTEKPDERIIGPYTKQKAELVEFDATNEFWKKRNTHPSNLIDKSSHVIRHDSEKLASLINEIILK
jgi:hypothetical protein